MLNTVVNAVAPWVNPVIDYHALAPEMVLAAAYLLWLFQRVAFGEPKAEFAGGAHGADDHGHSEFEDVNKFEWIAWTPLLIAIVVFGVVPNLLFSMIDPAVSGILAGFKG